MLKIYAHLILFLFTFSAQAEDISLCEKGWYKSSTRAYTEAITLFNECIKSGDLSKASLARTYRNIGITLKNDGQYMKAIENYNKALALNPADPWNDYVNRGNAWSESGNYQKAFEDYDKALEVKPNYHEAFYNRGIVYEKQGNYDAAAKAFIHAYDLGLRTELLYERLLAHGLIKQE